jgi:drug/metabolite transporter (DMT)-like permease
VVAAVLTSQGVGLAASIVLLALNVEAAPTQESQLFAAISGVCGVAGLGFFYLALARGKMGAVAPSAGLIGAGLPVLLAIFEGEVVSTLRLLGIVGALVAVVLISLPKRVESQAQRRALPVDLGDLPLILLTGISFAGFFIFLDKASESGGTWWPLVIVRLAGFAIVVGVFLFLIARTQGDLRSRAEDVLGIARLRAAGRTLVGTLPLFMVTGIADMGGNAFFVLARGADAFSVAVVLSSLYPIVTTLFATIFLRERLSRLQFLGVALATLSVPLLR